MFSDVRCQLEKREIQSKRGQITGTRRRGKEEKKWVKLAQRGMKLRLPITERGRQLEV